MNIRLLVPMKADSVQMLCILIHLTIDEQEHSLATSSVDSLMGLNLS